MLKSITYFVPKLFFVLYFTLVKALKQLAVLLTGIVINAVIEIIW